MRGFIRKSLQAFMFCLVLLAPGWQGALAADPCDGKVSIDFCHCRMWPTGPYANPDNGFAWPLVQCFASANSTTVGSESYPQGIIPYATVKILKESAIVTLFREIVLAAIALTIAIFGYRVYVGDIDRIKGDTAILIIKIGGVMYFIANAPDIYLSMLNIMTQLTDVVASVASSGGTAHFWDKCVVPPGGTSPVHPTTGMHIWGIWDCMFNYLLGFSGIAILTVGIIAFVMLMMATLGLGIFIFFAVVYFLVGLIFTAGRFLQVYIMGVFALSFMFLVGYMFVPLLLFKYTFEYFQKWLNLCIGYIMVPVMTLGFMAVMLVTLEKAVFTGDKSIVQSIKKNCGAGLCKDQEYKKDNSNNVMMDIALNHQQLQFKSYGEINHGNAPVTPGSDYTSPFDAGFMGSTRFEQKSGSYADQFKAATTARMGFDFKGLHLTRCTNGPSATNPEQDYYPPGCTADATPGTGAADEYGLGGDDTWKYLSGIFTSILVACLLVYIMYGLLAYIPKLVDDLVAQGTGAGKIGNAQVFGEALARNTLDTVKAVALAASGRVDMAVSQAANMMSKRN